MDTKTTQSTAGGFKMRTRTLERQIAKAKRELVRLQRLEKQARDKWTDGYHKFLDAAERLAELKVHRTQKEARLKGIIKTWRATTLKLTQARNSSREQVAEAQARLVELGMQLAVLKEQELGETREMNDIVQQVFGLNETVVQAATAREECLKRHVFPRLIGTDGKLQSQISFISADGCKRVVAMVNTMTIIRGDLAAEAKRLVEAFFARFQQVTVIDDVARPLYDLTRQLLIEKTDFKVGPDLYRFLSWKFDAELFPELAQAQSLLGESIRSEKTNSYIRIFKRASRNDNWEPVPQS